jgi:DNA repair exonuclease SbcCD ATPase subunit
MRFLGLAVENFMSFESLEFLFPQSGLFFVSGEVAGKPSSSNGAGKSTLFEALAFVLFGKTIRGLGKTEVVNRNVGKNCSVVLIFEGDDNREYTVTRYREHEKFANELHLLSGSVDLTEGVSTETQRLIESAVGMNWMIFSNAVLFGQKASRFAEGTDSEKKKIFDEILMLDIYQQAQTKVKEDLKTLLSQIESKAKDLSLISASSTDVQRSIDSESVMLSDLVNRSTNVTRLDEIEKEAQKFEEVIQKTKSSLLDRKKEKSEFDAALALIVKKKEKVELERQRAIQPLQSSKISLDVEASQKNRLISEVRSKLSNVGSLIGKPCPVCQQAVTEDSQASLIDHYKEEMKKLTDDVQSLSIRSKDYEKQIKDTEEQFLSKVAEALIERDTVIRKQKEIEDQILSLSIKQKEFEGKVLGLRIEKKKISEDLEGRKQDLLDRIKKLEEKKLQLAVSKTTIDNEILALREEEKYLRFWVDGFSNSGVKSLLLEEILPDLNSSVSYFSSMLTDGEIVVSFDTESQLKSGDMRDKFDVKILKDNELVPYDSCSGGERRRIDVAILLSLQNLIFKRSVKSCNLVVLDEVFENLDQPGIERVVNLLTEESKDKAVFVISHTSELASWFSNQIVVKKNSQGISSISN